MGVLALYEQTPSRLPVVQDCNYRAEGAGHVVNRQRHRGVDQVEPPPLSLWKKKMVRRLSDLEGRRCRQQL